MSEVLDVVLDGAGHAVPGVASEPAAPPRGGVVVLQEAYGLTPHIRSICGRLADAGYRAVAPALFHREGAPVFCYEDIEIALPYVGRLNHEEIDEDLAACFAHLAGTGLAPERCAIVGFCLGGTIGFVSATRLPIAAAISFYGGGILQGRFGYPALTTLAPDLRAPWLGLYGDDDPMIPVEQVEALRAQLTGTSPERALIRYPGAGHGFNCDDRDSFAPQPAADAWSRTLGWLEHHLPAT